MTKRLILMILPLLLLLGACESDSAPKPDSDNRSANFHSEERVPVDENIYTIKGEVYGDPEDLTRQVSPGGAAITGFNGFVSGSAWGPEMSGKGFVRVATSSIEPDPEFASSGDVVLIKTADTKMAALVPGDVVTIKCRAQYEAIAPILRNERITDKSETWEFDFCRLASPDIGDK